MEKYKVVSIRITEELKAKLDTEAKADHRSFSQNVAKILEDYIESK